MPSGISYDHLTWQVRRSDFDQMLPDEAVERGAKKIKGTAVNVLKDPTGAVCGVAVRYSDGTLSEIHTKITLDCSGQAAFLANQKATGPKYRASYDKRAAFFTHVRGAHSDEGTSGPDARTTRDFLPPKGLLVVVYPGRQGHRPRWVAHPAGRFQGEKADAEGFFRSVFTPLIPI